MTTDILDKGTTRLSKWAADIRAIKDTKLTPQHKRHAFQHLQCLVMFNNVFLHRILLFISRCRPWLG